MVRFTAEAEKRKIMEIFGIQVETIVLVLMAITMLAPAFKFIFNAIVSFIKSPVKAINAIKAKRAARVKVDRKEMKLRKKARDEYHNGEYLMSDKFTNHAEVKAHLDMRAAKENLKRHKEAVKNKK